MSAAAQREKSQRTAADLLARGFWHGRRQSKPYPNSGGLTLVMNTHGSSKYQRLMAKRQQHNQTRSMA